MHYEITLDYITCGGDGGVDETRVLSVTTGWIWTLNML